MKENIGGTNFGRLLGRRHYAPSQLQLNILLSQPLHAVWNSYSFCVCCRACYTKDLHAGQTYLANSVRAKMMFKTVSRSATGVLSMSRRRLQEQILCTVAGLRVITASFSKCLQATPHFQQQQLCRTQHVCQHLQPFAIYSLTQVLLSTKQCQNLWM